MVNEGWELGAEPGGQLGPKERSRGGGQDLEHPARRWGPQWGGEGWGALGACNMRRAPPASPADGLTKHPQDKLTP